MLTGLEWEGVVTMDYYGDSFGSKFGRCLVQHVADEEFRIKRELTREEYLAAGRETLFLLIDEISLSQYRSDKARFGDGGKL